VKICEVTGRVHRTPTELKAHLAKLDRQINALEAILEQFGTAFAAGAEALPYRVGDAYNATSDALDSLQLRRAEAEANPRPIPAGQAETWRLIKNNMD
jgi:hypothetical protein